MEQNLQQARAIATDLRRRFQALQINDPLNYGEKVALFITLVPGCVLLRITLTQSNLGQHGYTLRPLSQRNVDRTRFVSYLAEHHPEIEPMNYGKYAHLPGLSGVSVPNDDHCEIAFQVLRAVAFIVKVPFPDRLS